MSDSLGKVEFCACNMLAKNGINRNKMDNKVKVDNKNIDFMTFIQNYVNGYIGFEQFNYTTEW